MKKMLVSALVVATLMGGCAHTSEQSQEAREDSSRLVARARQVAATCAEETGSESRICDKLDEAIEHDADAGQLRGLLDEVEEAKARCVHYAISEVLTPELAFSRAALDGLTEQIDELRAGLDDTGMADAVAHQAQALAAYVAQVEAEKESYSCPKVGDVAADMGDLRLQVADEVMKLRSASAAGDVPFQEER